MKTMLLSNGQSSINNFVDRPSIFTFKPFKFLLLFVLFSLVARVGFGQTKSFTTSGVQPAFTLPSGVTTLNNVNDSSHIVTITTPTQATAKKLIYKTGSTLNFGNSMSKLILGSL